MNIDELDTHDIIAYGYVSKKDFLKKFINTFPIQCACSFTAKGIARDFKIVLRNSAVYAMKNIAIPAYNVEDELYSKKLSKLFKVTKPLCYEDFIGNMPEKIPFRVQINQFTDFYNDKKNRYEINGVLYIETTCYKYECELNKEKLYKIE